MDRAVSKAPPKSYWCASLILTWWRDGRAIGGNLLHKGVRGYVVDG